MEKTKTPIRDPDRIYSSCVARNTHSHYTEATLIKKMEELGIGRPSTFAMIVDTIQDRDYVKLTDVDGKTMKCNEFCLERQILATLPQDKTFGNEKNKLVIQPLGILAVEFLIQHFGDFFSYDYTKQMECELDKIALNSSDSSRTNICKNCLDDIIKACKPLEKLKKQSWQIDDVWSISFQQYGLVLHRRLDDGSLEWQAIRKDITIDLEKLDRNEYTFDDLVEIKSNSLGEYNGVSVYLKNGKYGPYVKWGDNTKSIKEIKKPIGEIRLDDILPIICDTGEEPNTETMNKNILRIINDELSIRNGKFGAYIFYQKKNMTKPKFLDIKKFDKGFKTCQMEELVDWISMTHGIPISS